MASATTTYNFTDEEVSHLANCNDQDDFLYNFQRILQSKGIDFQVFTQVQLELLVVGFCSSKLEEEEEEEEEEKERIWPQKN